MADFKQYLYPIRQTKRVKNSQQANSQTRDIEKQLEQIQKIETQIQNNTNYMFNLNFGGNPHILQLLESPTSTLDQLLDIDSFPSQFRTCNPKLQKFMDISRYNQLVQYLTQVGDPSLKNRAYKYPLQAAEILSIDNKLTIDTIFRQGQIIVQKEVTEEVWVEKQVDECDSQYCSSEGSNRNVDDIFEQGQDRENIPPEPEKGESSNNNRSSIQSKKRKSDKKSDTGSQGRKSLGDSSASITSDDFPFTEQTIKKIKVKKLITRKIETQIKPLLQQLCQYFEKQINYTLTGYIIKVLQLLLKKNPRRLLRQIFMTKNHKHLIKHIQSHVVCDFIVNLLLCQENQAQNAREYFVTQIFKSLVGSCLEEDSVMVNKSLLYILVQINAKLDPQSSKWHTILIEYLYQDSSLPKISSSIFDKKVQNPQQQTSNKNKDLFCQLLGQYLKKLLNPIIINAPNTASSAIRTTEQENIKELRQRLLTKYEICFKQFVDRVWETIIEIEINQKQMPSYVYIKQLQILNLLVKNNLFWTRMELSNQEAIFGPLLGLCEKFRNNNFLHNQVFQLLKQIVHMGTDYPILYKKTFNNKTFLNFCLDTIAEDQNPKPMYRGQCIYLCQLIRHNSCQQSQNMKKQFKSKWQKIQQGLLKNVQKINSTLGGFSVKRPHKTDIQFTKEAVIAKFQCFLKGEIPLKKKKSEDSELEDIASQGSAQWNDWNQFSNYSADEVDDKGGENTNDNK